MNYNKIDFSAFEQEQEQEPIVLHSIGFGNTRTRSGGLMKALCRLSSESQTGKPELYTASKHPLTLLFV